MKKYGVLLFLVVLTACSSTSKDSVELFNGLSFKLNADESLRNINPSIHKTYFSLFDSETFSVPLFKWVRGSDYSIFIGILYNDSIESFIHSEIIGQPAIELMTDSVTYGFMKSITNDVYVAKYISKQGGNNLFIVAMTPSSFIADSLFTYEKIKTRLQTK